MITVQDSITAPNNATLDKAYQVFQADGVTGQDITNWSFHSQWRYADGTLGLDLTLANGLLVVTDAPTGKYKILVTPYDLQTLIVGPLAFDILATPPASAASPAPETYVEVSGIVTITAGATQADFQFTVGAPCSTTGGSAWSAPPTGGGLTVGGLGTSLLDAAALTAALADAAASAQDAKTAAAQALVAAQAATQAQSSAAVAAAAANAAAGAGGSGSGGGQPMISAIDSGEQDDAGTGSASTGATTSTPSSGASSGETYTAIDSGTG